MEIKYNEETNTFDVTVTQKDLHKAFASERDLHIFMHDLVAYTYGEWIAEIAFPIFHPKGEDEE